MSLSGSVTMIVDFLHDSRCACQLGIAIRCLDLIGNEVGTTSTVADHRVECLVPYGDLARLLMGSSFKAHMLVKPDASEAGGVSLSSVPNSI